MAFTDSEKATVEAALAKRKADQQPKLQPATAVPPPPPRDPNLVPMVRDGLEDLVHYAAVAAREAEGWTVKKEG